jgi:hypothetical protein
MERTTGTIIVAALAGALSLLATAQAFAVDIKVIDDKDGKTATVLLSGTVAAGDGLKVRATIGALAASKAITVQLDSAGGNRNEAMSIGQFFHRNRIRTVVPAKTRCISPCPLILVGGIDPVSGKASYVKYSTASLGFSGVILNYQDKSYTAADLDAAVAGIQRDILQIADYLHDVGADMNLLKHYQSVLKPNEVHYITNEQALDLGIAVMFEETGQVIEPIARRP